MTAQPIRGEFQFSTQTAQRQEEIISKLNELNTGIAVGANYYPGGADKLKLRFGDHKHGINHTILTPQEMATLRNYMDNRDKSGQNPAFNKVRTLFNEADGALARAHDYIREEQAAREQAKPKTAPAVYAAA